jgi:hypothetical protein
LNHHSIATNNAIAEVDSPEDEEVFIVKECIGKKYVGKE